MEQDFTNYSDEICYGIFDNTYVLYLITQNNDYTYKLTKHDFSVNEVNSLENAISLAKKEVNSTEPIFDKVKEEKKEVLIDFFNILKDNSDKEENLLFKEFYDKYPGYLISVQSEYSYKDFKNNNRVSYGNFKKLKSYDWLYKFIGYYPMWTMLIRDEEENRLNEIDFNINVPNGKYVFILEKEEDDISTSFYDWCDIHYLLSEDIYEDEYERDKYLLDDISSILYIDKNTTIQVLKKEFNKKNVKAIYEIIDLKNRKFKLIYEKQ